MKKEHKNLFQGINSGRITLKNQIQILNTQMIGHKEKKYHGKEMISLVTDVEQKSL